MVLVKEIEIPEDLFEFANSEYETGWTNPKVKIKRFLTGETNAITRESISVKGTQIGDRMNMSADVDPTMVRAQKVIKGVAEAPWKVNDIEAYNKLPPFITDWVLGEIEEFNSITLKKNKNLNESSSGGNQETQK